MMRRLIALIAALLLSAPALAQERVAEKLAADAQAAMMADPEGALVLARQAEQRAAVVSDTGARAELIATALWLQSEALLRTGAADAAAPRITKALRLIAGTDAPGKLRGDLLLARAGVQQAQTKPAEALATLQEAFNIFGAVGEKRKQAITLQMIAALYNEANDFASAEKYFKQSASVYEGDALFRWSLHNNLGNALLQAEREAEATAQFRMARRIAEREGKDGMRLPVLANLARSLIGEGKLTEANDVVQEALAIAGRLGDGAEARPLAIAAEIAFQRKQLAQARTLIERSFSGVDLADTPIAYRDAHITAYEVYKALGEDKLALQHLERLRLLGVKTAKLATSISTALMAARFDYANQELRIANLQAEELRKSAAFQRTIFLGLGGATIVIIALLSVGLITLRRSRDQVRAANAELNQSNVALEKALKAKTEFLATTSHEIRTPLNGILGMTQIMLRDASVSAATRDRLGIVHGAGMTMRALVDDILDVAKMETGNMTVDLAATDLHAVLRNVTRMWEEQARAKGVAFTLDLQAAPRWIETDSGRLRQMLFNLLSNAVKFTEAGEIALRIAAVGDQLSIAVSDSGIGIPPEKHEEIFESFKQADSGTTRKFGGTGLGLAIVRNLARALGGEIVVASTEGKGTVFTVTLPLKTVETPADAVAAAEAGETIVVLDKNPIARGMLRTVFAPKFAAVAFAATPDEAIDLLPGDAAALLLADEVTLKASGDDPIGVLRALVDRADAAGVRTAVLWSKPDDAMTAALNETGVGVIVAKPVAGPALVAALLAGRKENDRLNGDRSLVSQAA